MINKAFILFLGLFMGLGGNSEKGEFREFSPDDLVGEFKQSDLEKSPHAQWFVPAYEDYKPKKKALRTIEKNIHDFQIVMFMGTWCGDSRYEVPKFFRLLDEVDYDRKKLTNFAVTYSKETPGDKEEEYNVHRVPTIIFIKNGKEVNRFVEFSNKSLEEDMAKIVAGEPYKNPYSE